MRPFMTWATGITSGAITVMLAEALYDQGRFTEAAQMTEESFS